MIIIHEVISAGTVLILIIRLAIRPGVPDRSLIVSRLNGSRAEITLISYYLITKHGISNDIITSF